MMSADTQVELKGVDYGSFQVPPCRVCEAEGKHPLGIVGAIAMVKDDVLILQVKPNVVFFVRLAHLRLL